MKRAWLVGVLFFLVTARPVPATEQTPPAPPARAKCPVCGMFVAKYPDWAGSIRFKDATTAYFDGPKDLFTYYFAVRKYDPAKHRSGIGALYVKDYYTLTVIDARKAFYVIGSDVRGPMGNELVPFAKEDAARGFLHDHRGRNVLRFGEITPETLKALE